MQPFTISISISAPRERVWRVLFDAESYRIWTAPFASGSRYEGSFTEGATIKFLTDENPACALASLVETVREPEFLSLRHDFGAPYYENYTLRLEGDSTLLTIDQDLGDEWAEMMSAIWPKALAEVKRLSEAA